MLLLNISSTIARLNFAIKKRLSRSNLNLRIRHTWASMRIREVEFVKKRLMDPDLGREIGKDVCWSLLVLEEFWRRLRMRGDEWEKRKWSHFRRITPFLFIILGFWNNTGSWWFVIHPMFPRVTPILFHGAPSWVEQQQTT